MDHGAPAGWHHLLSEGCEILPDHALLRSGLLARSVSDPPSFRFFMHSAAVLHIPSTIKIAQLFSTFSNQRSPHMLL